LCLSGWLCFWYDWNFLCWLWSSWSILFILISKFDHFLQKDNSITPYLRFDLVDSCLVLSVELFLLLFKLGASLGRLILQLSISQFTRFLEIISLLLDLFEFLVDLGSLTNWVLIFWPIWYSRVKHFTANHWSSCNHHGKGSCQERCPR
jgi:hypothetical protein